jgi:FKBP-type peptidyl-prolyl cis-trans isomerase FkpA/FKBP-type peptidyl-prolyl cis-trans isomerase FklB
MSAWSLIPVVGLLILAPPAAAETALDSDEAKAVYAMGLAQAKQLGTLRMTPAELALFQEGFADAVAGTPRLELAQQMGLVRQFQQARVQEITEAEKKEAKTYVEAAATEKGATVTESGLIFISTQDGLGDTPTIVDTVKVNYHGTLRDGTVFDSSVERGEPAVFALNRVIPCWTEALQMMRVGGKAKIVCPSEIAYGDRGAGQLIRPGAALSFDVELLEIEEK